MGGAQRIRDVGSATLLRLVAPPEVTAAHRLIARADAVWIPAAVPVRFREPMGGESGDGGYGGTGFRECGDAVGCKNSVGWVADSAPGALPPDPRQGLLAPGPPPRGDGPPWNRPPRWRVVETTALSGAATVGAALVQAIVGMRCGSKTRRMKPLTRRRGHWPRTPAKGGWPHLEPPAPLARNWATA